MSYDAAKEQSGRRAVTKHRKAAIKALDRARLARINQVRAYLDIAEANHDSWPGDFERALDSAQATCGLALAIDDTPSE